MSRFGRFLDLDSVKEHKVRITLFGSLGDDPCDWKRCEYTFRIEIDGYLVGIISGNELVIMDDDLILFKWFGKMKVYVGLIDAAAVDGVIA